jgi:hypothetical protein
MSPTYAQIKLALDIHAASIVAVRSVEGAKRQPPQTFQPGEFLKVAVQPLAHAEEPSQTT